VALVPGVFFKLPLLAQLVVVMLVVVMVCVLLVAVTVVAYEKCHDAYVSRRNRRWNRKIQDRVMNVLFVGPPWEEWAADIPAETHHLAHELLRMREDEL
jgi:threonine/homoserine/homoserine lactone efflux protein